MDDKKPNTDVDYKQSFYEQQEISKLLEEKLRLLEEKLYHSEKLASMGYVAAGVHHELTNPLSVSTANFQLIKDQVNELLQLDTLAWQIISYGAVREEYLIQHQLMCENDGVQELKDLLVDTEQGLMQVAEINDSIKTLSTTHHDSRPLSDINQCIASALIAVKNELKYTITVHQELESSLPLVPFHFGKIQQVLVNLLVNAKQAISTDPLSGQNIWIRSSIQTECNGRYVEISVIDDGIGITQEIQSKVFDPFFTTKENGGGTGLGLAISKNIVEQHNGVLLLKVEDPQFTQLIIRLPIECTLNNQ
ncbi:ATP-binding protein [Vibrio tapetis subsp. quintayensis]|uniref:sensor histidine kinase n=1 Tax=Vibrio tapetis TaxID=52443 RepID=UPI0025B462BC|nr:ATP-binding protein [Vibrio tapetis]MDN3680632.1 ATP-binding protein [Vibrio tapetis subsp. quintayensis]